MGWVWMPPGGVRYRVPYGAKNKVQKNTCGMFQGAVLLQLGPNQAFLCRLESCKKSLYIIFKWKRFSRRVFKM